ncbi:MAG TPA: ATP synthase F1 subunit gamma [Bacteroidota bacterium]|nr:ATP synthase F1 subunit gamma [Bacteroidota bacterium]
MATLRDIRRSIAGIKSTQKITKAMKMVAAAKLRRAQEAILQARPYARKMAEMLRHLSGKVDVTKFPELAQRPVAKVALVVVTADRGLCGGFNTNIVRAATRHIQDNYAALNAAGNLKLICVGKKGFEYFKRRNYQIAAKYVGLFHALQFTDARTIVKQIVDGYAGGEFDKVEIVYNEFKNAAQQRIVIEQFLPIPPDAVTAEGPHSAQASVDYIYEPSSDEIVSSLVPKHLNFQMWRVLLESNAAEQGARMTAMENASSNAKELIQSLQLSYNKARQASITKELLEIVSGAEALKSN